MHYPLIILGGGGHAKVLIKALLIQGRPILGFTDPNEACISVLDIPRLGDDTVIRRFAPEKARLVNGLGSIKSTEARRKLYDRFRTQGYLFESVVHPSAVIASDVRLEDGVQLMAGIVVQPGSCIGANTIVNTRATVDHDCLIGAHVHIAPGAVLSGGVRVEEGAHIGAGAILIQGVAIGRNSVIGAGAVVLKDVPPCVTVAGVPARILNHHATK